MDDLLARVEEACSDRCRLRRGEKVLVAVSGGVDSMVLLHVLSKLATHHRWQLAVAHFNHQLRGRSSDADERLVRKIASALALKIVVGRGNVRGFASRHGLSIEMAARHLRHEFLALAARRMKCRVVALAHHADDQVELFFLRLLRGAGSEGLAGMKWRAPSPADSHVQIVRPLLGAPKREIEKFAQVRRVQFRADASNATLDILRNRLRHELLPLLKRRFQPALEPAVLRAMNILSEESEFIATQAREWLHRENPPAFEKLAVAIQRRVLLEELLHLDLPADFETIEALRQADAPVTVFDGVTVSRAPDGLLRVRSTTRPEFRHGSKIVALSGKRGAQRFGGAEFNWRILQKCGAAISKRDTRTEYFDADVVGAKITLRHWKAGDRFQPIGMKSACKLQDLFTNAKIPPQRRREAVLAENVRGEVFWVEGLRIGEAGKLRRTTRRRLEWNWKRS